MGTVVIILSALIVTCIVIIIMLLFYNEMLENKITDLRSELSKLRRSIGIWNLRG